ncbi:F4 (K88) fimbria minor subunit FaeH [Salmonella enterica]|nr:fimbrial protein [Salmonella enterica subsp. enterica serovar Typhimurium]EDL2754683.1 F4 (K88) fimbria minor subunit FaeH [Salmonella enterica subsp. enterica serovar Typhimurium]EKB1589998.1 F4 (K88) fimbria minor subunit FaeH [Salmonella enterica]EKC7753646.1 F4 (K88) fimbria minor subunit FaeH [Salmonella enterica]ELF0383973.1 F4 (K88) fimbria minor subunit FaeH [Salmonella enterica]
MRITHHYKSLLSVIMSAALFYSTALHADILDGGEIQFNGLVTDEAPKWTWQISSPDQTWAVDTADARTENGQLVFNLRNKGTLPFLEGHLHEVAERGGPGFTPFITFSSNGQSFSVTDGGGTTTQHFRASVPVRNPENGHVAGQLSFTLDQGMAVSAGRQEDGVVLPAGMSLVNGQSVSGVQAGTLPQRLKSRLSALLMLNRGFGNGMSTADNGQVISQGVLADGRVTQLAAAYASAVSDFELRLPAENTPAQWQAGLSVTVTVQ